MHANVRRLDIHRFDRSLKYETSGRSTALKCPFLFNTLRFAVHRYLRCPSCLSLLAVQICTYFSSFSWVLSAGACLSLSVPLVFLLSRIRTCLRTFFMFLRTARFSLPKYNWRCDAPVFPSLSTPPLSIPPPTHPPFRLYSDHFLHCNLSPGLIP